MSIQSRIRGPVSAAVAFAAVIAPVVVSVVVSSYAGQAAAQDYPVKPVRFIVSLAAGTSSDTVARILATKLAEDLRQQFIIDNRPGAGGSVGGEMASRAPADGYTLFFAASGTTSISPNMMKLSYDITRDLAPVSLVGSSPFVMLTHPSLPVRTVKDFIALAKAKPGRINYGSSGQGATSHLAWELLRVDTGINIVHVPYKGAAALVALLSGEVEASIFGSAAAMPYIERKQLRPMAVTSARRIPLLPDVPAVAETVPGFEVSTSYALMTTAGSPASAIARLYKATVAAAADPTVKSRFAAAGVDASARPPEELMANIKTETAKWARVVKATGVRVE